MAVLPKLARRAGVVAAAASLSCLGVLTGASTAQAQPYPPPGGPFIVSTTLVIAGGHLTFTATLPFGKPIVVELNLPTPLPLPGPSRFAGTHAGSPNHQEAEPAQKLATLVPDARGHVFGSITIPRGTVPGDHVLTLATTNGHRTLMASPLRILPSTPGSAPSARIDVQDAAAVLPSRTQQDQQSQQLAKPLLAAGAMTVGAGLGGWALRRRRPRHDE